MCISQVFYIHVHVHNKDYFITDVYILFKNRKKLPYMYTHVNSTIFKTPYQFIIYFNILIYTTKYPIDFNLQ